MCPGWVAGVSEPPSKTEKMRARERKQGEVVSMSEVAVLHCYGCGAEIADRESARVSRWLAHIAHSKLSRPPLLCWVCAHLAADNAKEAKRAVEWVKEWPK